MIAEPDDAISVDAAKQNLAATMERLVVTAKEQAVEAIDDVTHQLRQSLHDTSVSVATDIDRLSMSIACGIRNIKEEVSVPQAIKDHPAISLVAGLTVCAAAVVVLGSLARASNPSFARTRMRGLGGTLALFAVDIGISLWTSRQQARQALGSTQLGQLSMTTSQ